MAWLLVFLFGWHSAFFPALAASLAPRSLVSDGAGNALYTESRYDDAGRVVASRDLRGRWSSTTYDDASNVLSTTNSANQTTRTTYDELNRAVTSTDAKGHVTTMFYDAAGRMWKTLYADGTTTHTTYDELNRPVTTTDQRGQVRTRHYDALGRVDYVEMPVASGQVLRTRFGFNELGQKTWQQDARGVQEDAAAGININVEAPQSRVTRFGYDVRGRLVQRILPGQFDGHALAENMVYNALGQLERSRDFRGYWTSYDYDERGRLLLKSPDLALQETSVSFSYPDEFTTVSQRGLAKTVTHQDPVRGWMTGVEMQSPAPSGTGTTLSTLSFAHDAYGRTQSQTLQSGLALKLSSRTTSFGYDGLDRLASITSDDGQTWGYGYDEVGNKTSLVRPNGTVTGYHYDELNRLDSLATRKGTLEQVAAGTAPLVSRFDYHLREDGRRDGLSEQVVQPDGTSSIRTASYEFDDANRLTGESGKDGQGKTYSKSYTLDQAGNRTASSYTLDGQLQAQTTYSYNSLDWLNGTSVQSQSGTSTTSYGYDANGSQISQTTGTATQGQKWDFEGHLLAQGAVDANGNWAGNRTGYSYDASGMRLTQAQFDAQGTLTKGTSYVWNGDRAADSAPQSGETGHSS